MLLASLDHSASLATVGEACRSYTGRPYSGLGGREKGGRASLAEEAFQRELEFRMSADYETRLCVFECLSVCVCCLFAWLRRLFKESSNVECV